MEKSKNFTTSNFLLLSKVLRCCHFINVKLFVLVIEMILTNLYRRVADADFKKHDLLLEKPFFTSFWAILQIQACNYLLLQLIEKSKDLIASFLQLQ